MSRWEGLPGDRSITVDGVQYFRADDVMKLLEKLRAPAPVACRASRAQREFDEHLTAPARADEPAPVGAEGVANCAECGAFLEQLGPGRYQHPHCSQAAPVVQTPAWPKRLPDAMHSVMVRAAVDYYQGLRPIFDGDEVWAEMLAASPAVPGEKPDDPFENDNGCPND